MTSRLSRDMLEQLTPLLGSLARIVASDSDLSESELEMLLIGGGLKPDSAVVEELERWGRVLMALRQEPSDHLRRAAVEGLKLRGLPEAPVSLAVLAVTKKQTVDQAREATRVRAQVAEKQRVEREQRKRREEQAMRYTKKAREVGAKKRRWRLLLALGAAVIIVMLIGTVMSTSVPPTSIPTSRMTVTAKFIAPASTSISRMAATATPGATACADDAVYVADVTVPDGTVFKPSEAFEKTWRVRNTGSCPWGPGYRLAFVSGDRMGKPELVGFGLVAPAESVEVTVAVVTPGESIEVTVALLAPESPGSYKGYWQMMNGNGECFGQRVYVAILVPDAEKQGKTWTSLKKEWET